MKLLVPSIEKYGGQPQRERVGLLLQVVLAGQLDRPIVGAVEADLAAGHDPHAELEADHRARVEAEEVRRQVAEVAFAKRPREAVGDAERALPLRQAQAGRQVDQREVGLRPVQDAVVGFVVGNGRRGGRRLGRRGRRRGLGGLGAGNGAPGKGREHERGREMADHGGGSW